MKPTRIYSLLLAAAILAATAACQRGDEPQAITNGQPTQVASEPVHIQVGSTRDPTLPDAGAVFAAQDAADKAKEDALALQQATAPQPGAAKSEDPKEAQAAPGPAPDRFSVAPENTKVN